MHTRKKEVISVTPTKMKTGEYTVCFIVCMFNYRCTVNSLSTFSLLPASFSFTGQNFLSVILLIAFHYFSCVLRFLGLLLFTHYYRDVSDSDGNVVDLYSIIQPLCKGALDESEESLKKKGKTLCDTSI